MALKMAEVELKSKEEREKKERLVRNLSIAGTLNDADLLKRIEERLKKLIEDDLT